MAAIVWSDVTNFASELSTVNATAQADILAHVNTVLRVDLLDDETGPQTKLARIFLAAHYGTLSLESGAGSAGPVTMEKAGDLSRSYGTVTGTIDGDPLLDSTVYGRMYRSIVNSSHARLPKVV